MYTEKKSVTNPIDVADTAMMIALLYLPLPSLYFV